MSPEYRDASPGAEPQTCVPLKEQQKRSQGVMLGAANSPLHYKHGGGSSCCRPTTPLSTGGLEDARRPVQPSPPAPLCRAAIKQVGTALFVPTHGTNAAAWPHVLCTLNAASTSCRCMCVPSVNNVSSAAFVKSVLIHVGYLALVWVLVKHTAHAGAVGTCQVPTRGSPAGGASCDARPPATYQASVESGGTRLKPPSHASTSHQ